MQVAEESYVCPGDLGDGLLRSSQPYVCQIVKTRRGDRDGVEEFVKGMKCTAAPFQGAAASDQ